MMGKIFHLQQVATPDDGGWRYRQKRVKQYMFPAQ